MVNSVRIRIRLSVVASSGFIWNQDYRKNFVFFVPFVVFAVVCSLGFFFPVIIRQYGIEPWPAYWLLTTKKKSG